MRLILRLMFLILKLKSMEFQYQNKAIKEMLLQLVVFCLATQNVIYKYVRWYFEKNGSYSYIVVIYIIFATTFIQLKTCLFVFTMSFVL